MRLRPSRWCLRSRRRCSSTSHTFASTTRPPPCRCCVSDARSSRLGRCSRTAAGCSVLGWRRPVSLLYAAALALASLALVQSVAAGGIGVLAYVSARVMGRRLEARERNGALISVFGLVALAVSLAGGSGAGGEGSTGEILLWLAGTAAGALVVVGLGRRTLGFGVASGIAGGLFFSIGDISTEVATQGEGARLLFVVPLILGYTLGTWLLQLGYQRSGALTVAGVATLLTNALPIAAGTVVLDEPVPSGVFGGLRILAFAAVTVGAILLARPGKSQAGDE